jgi:hypothetical protein
MTQAGGNKPSQPRGRGYLLNFAASYSTGGYKRLTEYASWFDRNGGASFVIHPRCAHLATQYQNIRFFIARQSRFERLYNDCAYLDEIEQQIGQPELYYSYGIPLYSHFGRVSWFHLSNVLPLGARGVPATLFERLKAAYLGTRIRAGLKYADVISAESSSSLKLLAMPASNKLFVSVNGSDDELARLQCPEETDRQDIATVVGTAPYKALGDTYRLFETLKRDNPALKLMIFGQPEYITAAFLAGKCDIVVRGLVPRAEVIECLRSSKFYLSTTRIENSYNAAAEGIFLAEESYISDIGPHRELLLNMPFDEVSVPGVPTRMLHLRRAQLTGANLRSWETVVEEMIARFRQALGPDP